MTIPVRERFCATVSYADIFDFPLTRRELWLWCIGGCKGSIGVIPDTWGIHPMGLGDWFLLEGRKQIIVQRQKRRFWSKKKWLLVRHVARWFSIIPTIELIGVTGGLAMDNAKKEDDMDLFFVTSSGALWMTRFLATIIVELLGVRRKPGDTDFANKICLNMFMAEDALALPKGERDVFAAHEVLQMVSLWERGGTYKKFLSANRWVRDFLPNAWGERYQGIRITYYGKKQDTCITLIRNTSTIILRLFESLTKAAQLWYMKKRRTNEVVSDSVIRFHPRDARVWVKQAFARRLKRFNIPLDKIFYGS